MRRLSVLLCLLLFFNILVFPQNQQGEQQLVSPPRTFFVPHWFFTAQLGGSFDRGEAEFKDLISPAAQLSLGYKYNKYFSTRLAVSGWEARNKYAFPEAKYRWNFIQPSLDAMFDVTSLIGGWDPYRCVDVYAFAGLGLAYSFNNDDAVEADKRFGVDFQKLWHDTRFNPVVRAGIGADIALTDFVALSAEVNANMMPDHFNSKLGKHDNRDWHFNALVGLKFTIGRSHGRTEPVYRTVQPQPAPVDVPIDKISFNVNVYFVINQSVIRPSEEGKLHELIDYLNRHPNAFVRLSGYADKETGNPDINMRLSIERAEAVSRYLTARGIAESRIRRFAKGDRVQPFDIPSDNRVCICFVYNPDEE